MKNVEQDKRQKVDLTEREALKNTFKVSRQVAEDITGCIDDAEREELEEWLREADDRRVVYQEIKEDFIAGQGKGPCSDEQLEQQLKMFHRKRTKSIRRYRVWWSYAAVFVLLLGLAAVIRWQIGSESVERVTGPIQVARGNAMLILSTGVKVTLLDSLQSVREEPSVDIRVTGQKISYRNESEPILKDVYNRLVVPRGGEFKIELADGTNVWLNAKSELRYPVQFTGDERVVYLKGEGYFEVSPNKEKPFVVKTFSDVDVKVLGTRFNVSAYEEDADVITTLAEGSVEVIMPSKSIRIVPDEQLIFNKKERSSVLREVKASNYSAWKDGNFIFEDQRLEQIMEQLERWYEIDVFYAGDDVKNYRFTGDLKKYDSFEKIVKMIEEVAGVCININGKSIVIGTK